MNNKQNNIVFKPNMLVVGFVVAQVIFIAFLGVSISQLSQSDEITDDNPSRIPVATIKNFDSVVPDGYYGSIEILERTLFELILKNTPSENVSTSVDVMIREDSVKTMHFEEQNINYLSAIVDIPDLEQSYWFYNEYSNDKNNQYIEYYKSFRIFCLVEPQDIIYPEFNCKDDFGLAGRRELVSDLITYFDFNYFSPSYSTAGGSVKIMIYPHSFDIDSETKQLYVQRTKEAVVSLGVPPDLFVYYVAGPGDIIQSYPPQ